MSSVEFIPIEIPLRDWLHPLPEHEGERIVWSDGSVHGCPEDAAHTVTVLRRCEPARERES